MSPHWYKNLTGTLCTEQDLRKIMYREGYSTDSVKKTQFLSPRLYYRNSTGKFILTALQEEELLLETYKI